MTNKEIALALIGAVAGISLQGLVAAIVALKQLNGREFAGIIYAILPPSGGKSERIDRMRVRQSGQHLKASIKRLAPSSERGYRWRMAGYTHGNTIVAVFHTTAPRKDSSSYGVMVMHRDPNVKECAVWKGYYVRPDLHGLESIKKANVARYPLIWQQVHPDNTNYGRFPVWDLEPEDRRFGTLVQEPGTATQEPPHDHIERQDHR